MSEREKSEKDPEKDEIFCDRCGRVVEGRLGSEYDFSGRELHCRGCIDENESCGCSDQSE